VQVQRGDPGLHIGDIAKHIKKASYLGETIRVMVSRLCIEDLKAKAGMQVAQECGRFTPLHRGPKSKGRNASGAGVRAFHAFA